MRGKPITDRERDRVCALYNDGVGYRQLAKATGRNIGSIANLIYRGRKAGLVTHQRRDSNPDNQCECGRGKKVHPIWGCAACMALDKPTCYAERHIATAENARSCESVLEAAA